jgi:hypothetical protein
MGVRNVMVGLASAAGGAAVVALAQAQNPKPAATGPVKPASAVAPAVATEPAKAPDLSTMVTEARTALGKLRDYSGTFTRQERIKGALSAEQVGEMKVRTSPAGVYVNFVRPEASAGMEVSYSAKKGKVAYRPAGVAGRRGFQKIDADDAKFLADNRHPVPDWGMGPMLELVAAAAAREKTLNNPVEVYTSEYQFAARNVTRYEILMRRPHAFRYAAKVVVFVDKETKLPVRFEAYDDPKAGATTGDLLEAYSYTDLKFNTGVGENSFEY